jgi:uncharacterized membrane protein
MSTSDKYSEYWVLIFDLVLRGKLDLAWQMLLSHPDIISRDDSQEVIELESIFQSHPLLSDPKSLENTYSFRTGSASREKNDEWLHWKQVFLLHFSPRGD